MKNDRYEEKDFVQVVDGGDVLQPDRVPKRWVGTDLLPPGWKQAHSSRTAATPAAAPVPPESSGRDVLEAFAVNSAGMTAEDAAAFENKADLHAAIVKATSQS